MKNIEVRNKLKDLKIAQWRLAEKLNIGETTLVRRLRKELSNEEKEKLLENIELLSKEAK